MALRLLKTQLLSVNSKQFIKISSKCISKDVSKEVSKDVNLDKKDPVEHKELIYKDGTIKHVEKKTHTKQMWDEDDFRLARFIDKEKQINESFAIDLIADTPPIQCKDRVISCDGGDGPLGHPRVFINLDQPGNHSCGYCGLRFYLDHHH